MSTSASSGSVITRIKQAAQARLGDDLLGDKMSSSSSFVQSSSSSQATSRSFSNLPTVSELSTSPPPNTALSSSFSASGSVKTRRPRPAPVLLNSSEDVFAQSPPDVVNQSKPSTADSKGDAPGLANTTTPSLQLPPPPPPRPAADAKRTSPQSQPLSKSALVFTRHPPNRNLPHSPHSSLSTQLGADEKPPSRQPVSSASPPTSSPLPEELKTSKGELTPFSPFLVIASN